MGPGTTRSILKCLSSAICWLFRCSQPVQSPGLGSGDLQVDDHHTVEDIGICLGRAIKECLGDKRGVKRYGSAIIPMDEALAQVVVDLSGRPYLDFNVCMPMVTIGGFATELVEEFFRALVKTRHDGSYRPH